MFIKYGLYLKNHSGHFEEFKDDFSEENYHRVFDTREDCQKYMDEIMRYYKALKVSHTVKTERSGFMYLRKRKIKIPHLDKADRDLIDNCLKNIVIVKQKINLFRESQ